MGWSQTCGELVLLSLQEMAWVRDEQLFWSYSRLADLTAGAPDLTSGDEASFLRVVQQDDATRQVSVAQAFHHYRFLSIVLIHLRRQTGQGV